MHPETGREARLASPLGQPEPQREVREREPQVGLSHLRQEPQLQVQLLLETVLVQAALRSSQVQVSLCPPLRPPEVPVGVLPPVGLVQAVQ